MSHSADMARLKESILQSREQRRATLKKVRHDVADLRVKSAGAQAKRREAFAKSAAEQRVARADFVKKLKKEVTQKRAVFLQGFQKSTQEARARRSEDHAKAREIWLEVSRSSARG